MNEKLSLQNVVDLFSKNHNVPRKNAEAFAKAFFETVIEALYAGEESVKVKGFGTFKLVNVDSRESVNVNSGERFVIPGYKKITFTPEESVVEVMNSSLFVNEDETEEAVAAEPVVKEAEEVPAAEVASEPTAAAASEQTEIAEEPESVVAETPVLMIETEPQQGASSSIIETEPVDEPAEEEQQAAVDEVASMIEVEEPAFVETPEDEFSGIDMLIETPESIEEVRIQYEEAKHKMEAAVEVARQANAEKLRYEKLLARLESYSEPEQPQPLSSAETTVAESGSDDKIADDTPQPLAVVSAADASDDVKSASDDAQTSSDDAQKAAGAKDSDTKSEGNDEVLDRYLKGGMFVTSAGVTEKKKSTAWKWWVGVPVFLIVLAGVCWFIYTSVKESKSAAVKPKTEQTMSKPQVPVKTPAELKADSIAKAKADSIKAVKADSIAKVKEDSIKQAKQDSIAALQIAQINAEKKAKEEAAKNRPRTHYVLRGESLTRISMQYYGTKDSVRALIRVNNFKDPNNVPAGSTIKLP